MQHLDEGLGQAGALGVIALGINGLLLDVLARLVCVVAVVVRVAVAPDVQLDPAHVEPVGSIWGMQAVQQSEFGFRTVNNRQCTEKIGHLFFFCSSSSALDEGSSQDCLRSVQGTCQFEAASMGIMLNSIIHALIFCAPVKV